MKGGYGAWGGSGGKGGWDAWGGACGGACSGKGAAWGPYSKGGFGGDDEFQSLVANVKQIQKSGDEEKQKWWSYCDRQGMTTYDPARHAPAFLKSFLQEYQSGEPTFSTPNIYAGMEDDGKVVRLRGLPFSATVAEVMQFLAEYEVDASQVAVNHGLDGRPTGEAFAIFPTAESASRALQELQRAQMGTRYIELFASTYAEWGRANEASERMLGMAVPRPRGVEQSTGDPDLDGLVLRIKSIQRSGEDAKMKWWAYCDSTGASSRGYDPKRHSSEFLNAFLTAFDAGML